MAFVVCGRIQRSHEQDNMQRARGVRSSPDDARVRRSSEGQKTEEHVYAEPRTAPQKNRRASRRMS